MQPDQVVVTLDRGASFGGGEHPTTRLAIQLIDATLHRQHWMKKKQSLRAIDIGTGSGILAIAAAKIGLGCVCAVDTDPCAVFEARENVRLNRLEDRVLVLSGDLNRVEGVYDFVFANLRAPTLLGMRSILEKKISAESVLIFSGVKTDETLQICEIYKEVGFFRCEKRSENGWSALCLIRGDLSVYDVAPMSRY
jgi:ribosomal protein L11 methyltransferase